MPRLLDRLRQLLNHPYVVLAVAFVGDDDLTAIIVLARGAIERLAARSEQNP